MAYSFDFNDATAASSLQYLVPETASVASAQDLSQSSLVAEIPGLPSNPNMWTKDDKVNWYQGVGHAYDIDVDPIDDILPVLDNLEEFLKFDDQIIENADILKNDLSERLAANPQQQPMLQATQYAMSPTPDWGTSSLFSSSVSLPETTSYPVSSLYTSPAPFASAAAAAPFPKREPIPTTVAPDASQYYSLPQYQSHFHAQYQYPTRATPPPYTSPLATPASVPALASTHFQFPSSYGAPPSSSAMSSPSMTPPSAIPPYSPVLQRRGFHGSLSSLVDSMSASSSAYTTDDENEFLLAPHNAELQNIPTIAFSSEDGSTKHPQLHNLGPGLVGIAINPKTLKPKRKRRKKIRSSVIPPPLLPNRGANCTLWEFFLELLYDPANYETLIKWTDREQGEFKIVDSEVVSVIWGLLKNKTTMKYDHMSRSIRYYYGKNILDKVPDKQLVYRFGFNSNWLAYEPKSQGLDMTRMPAEPIEICGRVAKPKLFAVAKLSSPLS